MTEEAKRVEVRATINQAGLQVGQVALVDPDLPYIAVCLESGLLVPTGREFSVPRVVRRGAERPAAPPAAVEEPTEPAKKTARKRPPRKKT